jgi:hypothetical protein
MRKLFLNPRPFAERQELFPWAPCFKGATFFRVVIRPPRRKKKSAEYVA